MPTAEQDAVVAAQAARGEDGEWDWEVYKEVHKRGLAERQERLRSDARSAWRAMDGWARVKNEDEWQGMVDQAEEGLATGRFLIDRLGAERNDVLVTRGLAATRAAQAATSTIPIVFASVPAPVGSGLVASLARPGGNVTGLANLSTELQAKRLELLAQVVPGLQRVAFLWDPLSPASSVQELQAAAQTLGVRLQVLEIRDVADYEAAFAAAGAEQADALMVGGGMNSRNRARIVSLVARARLPAMYISSQAVRDGGLMAYGADALDSDRRAATYVDKILKGTPPADLPVEQPMRFDFVINLQTAQTLGLTIPHHVLLQATEVIQ